MFALLRFFLALFSSLFKSKSRLEAENAALRRQLIVLQRKRAVAVHFTNNDRLFLIQLRLVGGSIPPSPTTQSYANRDFSVHCEYQFDREAHRRVGRDGSYCIT
jgi:hypothetical protein